MIDSALRWLTGLGVRRGRAGEHWAWFVLALCAWLLRRSRRQDLEVNQVVGLRRGESVIVRRFDSSD